MSRLKCINYQPVLFYRAWFFVVWVKAVSCHGASWYLHLFYQTNHGCSEPMPIHEEAEIIKAFTVQSSHFRCQQDCASINLLCLWYIASSDAAMDCQDCLVKNCSDSIPGRMFILLIDSTVHSSSCCAPLLCAISGKCARQTKNDTIAELAQTISNCRFNT
jgi:hypothetical protein